MKTPMNVFNTAMKKKKKNRKGELTPKSQTKIQKKIYAKRLRGILVAFAMQLPV